MSVWSCLMHWFLQRKHEPTVRPMVDRRHDRVRRELTDIERMQRELQALDAEVRIRLYEQKRRQHG
jgi:F0F1-type ATP synthase membrane subunit b/b'